jgi:hypothetical protein
MKNPCGLPAAGVGKTGLKKLAKNARYRQRVLRPGVQ